MQKLIKIGIGLYTSPSIFFNQKRGNPRKKYVSESRTRCGQAEGQGSQPHEVNADHNHSSRECHTRSHACQSNAQNNAEVYQIIEFEPI